MADSDFLDDLKEDFYNESQGLLFECEQNLLLLEKDSANKDAVDKVFRNIHTLKGISATLGFDRITRLGHEIETILTLFSNTTSFISSEVIDALFSALDCIRELVKARESKTNLSENYETQYIKKLKDSVKKHNILSENVESQNDLEDSPQTNNIPQQPHNYYTLQISFHDNINSQKQKALTIYTTLQEHGDIVSISPSIENTQKTVFEQYTYYIFRLQTSLDAKQLYEKVYKAHETKAVQIHEAPYLKDDSFRTQRIELLNNLNHELVNNKLKEGFQLYYIQAYFNQSNTMKNIAPLLLYNTVQTKGEILISDPSYSKLQKDIHSQSANYIILSNNKENELQKKFFLPKVVQDLDIQRIEKLPEKTHKTISSENKKTEIEHVSEHHIHYKLKIKDAQVNTILNLVGEMILQKVSLIKINDSHEQIFAKFFQLLLKLKSNIRRLENKIKYSIESIYRSFERESTQNLTMNHAVKSELQNFTEVFLDFDVLLNESKTLRTHLKNTSHSMNRLVDELQENVIKMRMLPIDHVLNRLPRIVRDISKSLNKKVLLTLKGTEIEFDKTLIEALLDPLVHIIRNALDHGIESPDERIKKGKNEQGQLKVIVEYHNNIATITISDDGQGINLKDVRQRAIELKIIQPDKKLKRQELLHLIFYKGFTTKNSVTVTSGRGMGLDAVREKIEQLSGVISVTTLPNEGSTFIIHLPLTLAIIRVLFIRIAHMIYAIPRDFIFKTLCVSEEEIETNGDVQRIRVHNEFVQVYYLHNFLDLMPPSTKKDNIYVIVLIFQEKRLCFMVDDLLDERDIVVKPLDSSYVHVDGISGATILEDGQIGLIIDVVSIFRCKGECY